jgi:hypothetical protein
MLKQNQRRLIILALVMSALLLTVLVPTLSEAKESRNFEIWAIDQSETVSEGGGKLYIWQGKELSRNPSQAKPEVIDLAEAAMAAGCEVGRRPHMLHTNESNTRVVVSQFASGATHFFDVKTRKIVGCVSTKDAALGAINSHNSQPTPDESMVIVDTIGTSGKSGFLHKIKTDYVSNEYQLLETLDLSSAKLQDGQAIATVVGTDLLRPVCQEYTADSKFAYITLENGGLLVLDVGNTEGRGMQVVKAYPSALVKGIGCGAFRLLDEKMITNGESGQFGGGDYLYVFDTSQASQGIFPDPTEFELPGEDTHALFSCRDNKGKNHAVTMMRVSNDVNFVDFESQQIKSLSLKRDFSPNPTPDISLSVGNKVFAVLRGAKPLSAITALQDANRTPGVAVLELNKDCDSFSWKSNNIAAMQDDRTTTLNNGQVVPASDPHGLQVVILDTPRKTQIR